MAETYVTCSDEGLDSDLGRYCVTLRIGDDSTDWEDHWFSRRREAEAMAHTLAIASGCDWGTNY